MISNRSPVVYCTRNKKNEQSNWMKVKNTYFHSQNNGIDHNQRKYCVFEWRRCDKPPDFQLNSFHRYITFDWFSFQCKFNAFSLKRISKMTRICLFFFVFRTWFLSSSQFLYSCSPSFWNVTITKPTKIFTIKNAMTYEENQTHFDVDNRNNLTIINAMKNGATNGR